MEEETIMRNVGIDVGSTELVTVICQDGKCSESKTFDNTFSGHQALIKYLKPNKHHSRVCMEATGVYHFDAAVAISQTDNLDVMILNPKTANRFSQALAFKDKTDKVDAKALAIFAERMEFIAWKCPDNTLLALRAYARQLAKLTRLRTAAKNQLHALSKTTFTPKPVLQSQKKAVTFCEREIKKLEALAIEFIKQDVKLYRRFELLLTIKGVGETSAIQLLGELSVLPPDMTHKQWVAHAGLNPKQHQSGSSIKRKSYISKAGNKYLRRALYMPALSAANHDPYVRGFYMHLQNDNGLLKMQAICAVMRKLLHAIWGMFETDRPFDNQRFYAVPFSKNSDS